MTKTPNLALILLACFSLCGCVTARQPDAPAAQNSSPDAADVSANACVKLLCLTANVDGSGRFIFNRDSVHYEHKNWSPPVEVTLNGEPWTDLARTPAGWHEFSRGLDLSRAWIVKRQGRDVIALETTAAGFDLYLCDSPNGSADYAVTIAIPCRN